MIVSPLSVANALALLSQGANGKIFEELKTGLHLCHDKSVAANQFLEHRETLQKNLGDSTLSIVNCIYVQQGQQLNKNVQEVAVSKFKSVIETLNFVDSDESAQTINNFVEEKTNGQIKGLIKSNQLNADTRLVLINAIYFKGNWEKPFRRSCTRNGHFYISETEKVSVDFMSTIDSFNYAYINNLDASVLEMKYANSNMSFVIVLPEERMGLTALETKMKTYDLSNMTEKIVKTRFCFSVPKLNTKLT